MALIRQLVRRELGVAAIKRKRRKIQAVINANPTFKRAVDERVGARRPTSQQQLETARIAAIRAVMRENLRFARLVADAATAD